MRADVAVGIPYALPRTVAIERCDPTRTSGRRRFGRLDGRGWYLKLYASELCAARLRPEDLAVASRAARAVLAEPRPAPVRALALLGSSAEEAVPAGALALTAYWWEGADLYRVALLLGDPPCGVPERSVRVGSMAEHDLLDLLAREIRAWRRAMLKAAALSLAAYLA